MTTHTTPAMRFGMLPAFVLAGFFSTAPESQAQTYNNWTGSGTDWNTGSNWSSGSVFNYGQLEFKGGGNATSNNNAGTVSQWRVYFSGSQSYTLNSSGGQLNLFDFSGAHSWILSDSTVKQTFNTLQVNFAATAGATFGQISARSTGELAFNNVGITGSQVAQLRIAGQSSGKVTFSGDISGSGKAVVIGIDETGGARASTDVVFNGASTYSGNTFINAGKLTIGSGGSLNNSTIQLGDTNATGAAATFVLGDTDGGQTLGNTITVRTGSSGVKTIHSLNTSGTNSLTGAITLDDDLTLKQESDGTMSTSTGTFDIKAKKLTADVASGGTVSILQALTSTLGAGGMLLKQGSGTLILGSTSNNHTGTNTGTLNANGTQITGGTLAIAGDASLGLAPAGAYNNVQFTGSGTLRANASIGLHANRNISIASGSTASFDSNGNTFTINGIVNGSGGNVQKSGSGTVVFTGANSYTGATSVTTGTLLVNGNQSTASGAVSVAAAATLGGNGTVGGATTFTGASVHAPGSAVATVGTQAFSSTLAYGTGTIFNWDIDVTSPSASIYDKVTAVGAITGGAAVFKIVLAAGDSFSHAFWNSNRTWTDILGGAGAPAGSLATIFSSFDASGGISSSGVVTGQGSFSLSSGTNTLTWTAVPEPTSALAGLLLTAGLIRRRRIA